MSEPIILTALPIELIGVENKLPYKVYYTGVGKVNAAYRTANILNFTHPSLIINYGTAASLSNRGKLIKCTNFIQRDIDVTGLGFRKTETPFDDQFSRILEFNDVGEICYTGDTFITDNQDKHKIYDMEAYAIAKVCKVYQKEFVSYKYISDGGDENASQDWEENCKLGAKLFLEELKNAFL